MICVPGYIRTQVSLLSYRRRLTGDGPSPRSQRRRRVECGICGEKLSAGALRNHTLVQHGVVNDPEYGRADAPGRQPAQYRISFPRFVKRAQCPVEGCPGSATTRLNLRRHFAFRHPRDTLCILEEGTAPLPRCERCWMHCHPSSLSSGHFNTAICREGAARVRQRLAVEDSRRAREQLFTAKGEPLESVSVFRYLGRPLSAFDVDWPAIYRNLSKARARWARISRVLSHEGADPKVSGVFYKTVVNSVLLYGCETWVVSPQVLRVLGGFHHRVARRLSGLMPSLRQGEWYYPPLEDALSRSGLLPIEDYIMARQNRLVEKVATRPILDLCRNSERLSGSRNQLRWWTQPNIVDRLT